MKTFTNDAAKAAYNEIYQLTKTLNAEDEGNLIARLLSDMLNHSQNTDVEAFIEYWNSEHRTLQQRFTSLVAKWLQGGLRRLKNIDSKWCGAWNGAQKGAFHNVQEVPNELKTRIVSILSHLPSALLSQSKDTYMNSKYAGGWT